MSVKLHELVEAMKVIAPLEYAEEWDNVGLLLEPSKPRPVKRVMLTIDLTEHVLDEAIDGGVQAIVAYHPPIFEGVKRLAGWSHWGPKQRTVVKAIEHRIAVYSPHTALDAAPGGVNDFLAEMFAGIPTTSYAIKPHRHLDHGQHCKLVVYVPQSHVDPMREALSAAGAGWIGNYTQCSFGVDGTGTFEGNEKTNPAVGRSGRLEHVAEVRLEMVCDSAPTVLMEIEEAIRKHHPYEVPAWDLYKLEPKSIRHVGQGRDICLQQSQPLEQVVKRVKKHLKLSRIRVAVSERHRGGRERIEMVALCAGAGGSMLAGLCGFDLFITGEMRHHDVLAANARGTSVILTDHTNTERPYLPVFRKKIAAQLGRGVEILISKRDAEPLKIV